tara:strand:- start:174 stop:1130 length:957 start_codon:yes stop_codon:yes gene_type:complete
MRIAIWGLGNHAINNIAPALKKTPNLDLAGIFTRNQSIRNKCSKDFNCKTWNDHSEMLEDSDIDIVYCSTPPALHHQMGLEVISAGKHFWCEKPMTMSLEESKSLVEISDKADLTIAEGFMYLYHPQLITLKDQLNKYALEDIKYINIVFTLPNSNNIGFRNNLDLGGSTLLDIGTYNISLALEIFNQKTPEILYKKIKKDESSKVDVSGFATLNFNHDSICDLFWGMGFGYRNEVNILTTSSSLYANKIFSKKEDYQANILLKDKYGEENYIECKHANHFVNMFTHFRSLIDNKKEAKYEKERIIQLAKITQDIKAD